MLAQPCHFDYFAAMHTQCVPLFIIQFHCAPSPVLLSPVLAVAWGVPGNRLNSFFLPSVVPFFPSSSKMEEKNCIALDMDLLGPQKRRGEGFWRHDGLLWP